MSLQFDNYRVVNARDLSAELRRTIGAHDEARLEAVDIYSGKQLRYHGYFFEGGSAAVVDEAGNRVLSAVQHNIEPNADPSLVAALRDAYERASPRIEQTIFFEVPSDAQNPRLGALTHDADADCWYADVASVRYWISGDTKPDPEQVRQAAAVADDFEACQRAVHAALPGASIREIELWKPGVLIIHLADSESPKIELPWPP